MTVSVRADTGMPVASGADLLHGLAPRITAASGAGRWRGRLVGSIGGRIGLALVVLLAVGALGAPWLSPHDPTAQQLELRVAGPSLAHPLGTDALGRDVLSRLLWGARASLGTAAAVMALVLTVAVAVGLVSGFYGGWLDQLLMRLVDLLMAFPGIILALAVAGVLGPGLTNVMLAVAAVSWVEYARVIRGMALAAREREHVLAARALGADDRRIIARHVLPSLAGQIVVLATLDMGRVILTISGLNFLGLGAQPPTPEWGAMLNDGRPFLQLAPQLMILPGLAISLAVLGCNLLGDGLRDVFDPQTEGASARRAR